jgi:hypothetical protein
LYKTDIIPFPHVYVRRRRRKIIRFSEAVILIASETVISNYMNMCCPDVKNDDPQAEISIFINSLFIILLPIIGHLVVSRE